MSAYAYASDQPTVYDDPSGMSCRFLGFGSGASCTHDALSAGEGVGSAVANGAESVYQDGVRPVADYASGAVEDIPSAFVNCAQTGSTCSQILNLASVGGWNCAVSALGHRDPLSLACGKAFVNVTLAAVTFGGALPEEEALLVGEEAGPEAGKMLASSIEAEVKPQIEARWSAKEYKHGGLMSTIEHINYRHASESGFENVSRFAKGTSVRTIKDYVGSALRLGIVKPNGSNGHAVEYDLGKVIGTDQAGSPVTGIRVYVRDGIIQTAFPVTP